MALDNQRKETAALQHDTPTPDATGMIVLPFDDKNDAVF